MSISRNRLISKILDKDTGLVKSSLSDSDQIVASGSKGIASSSAGTTVYATLANLPGSATTGDQAFVSSNNGLYIYNGSGWYKVALVNATPYWDSEASASYTFTVDTAITISLLAGDSDGHSITYTATPDSDANLFITISKDSDNGRIFTLTPDSENEAPASSNTGNITFKASDGISFASTVSSFTLTFSTTIDNSAETVLLMKATGSGKAHEGISYQYGSDASLDVVGFSTTTGTPVTSSFSPYREGGYSTYFDGTGDYISLADSTSFDLSSSDFTVEFWVYQIGVNADGVGSVIGQWSSTDRGWVVYVSSSNIIFSYSTNGTNYINFSDGAGITYNEWTHVAAVRNGNTIQIYKNGTQTYNAAFNDTIYNSSRILEIGANQSGTYGDFNGYIRDVRVVKGTAVYTSTFTPPTETLTAISGTSLLACHLPYFKDGSTNNHTLTVNNNTKISPFGPYDYNPHVHNGGVSSDVGSFYLSTGTDGVAETTGHQTISNFGSGDFTIECWYYPTGLANYQTLYSGRANTSTYGQLSWFIASSGNFLVYSSSSGGSWDVISESGTTVRVNDYAWNHIALVRNGSDFKVYVNGVGETIATSSSSLTANTLLQIGYENPSANSQASGYISDYRIVKGTAVYTSNFTSPTEPLTWITNTTLLLNNKYDTYIYDAAAANKLTLAGDTQSTTAQRKFTTSSSVSFDGTGDYAYLDNSELFALGAGDFTVEAWIYYTTFSGSGGQAIVSTGTSTSSAAAGHWYLTAYGTTDLRFGRHGSAQYTSGASSLSTNTWHHLAVAREGTTVRIFVDGTGLTTSDTAGGVGSYDFNNSSGYLFVGEGASFSPANGYMQDLRITKGLARYTTNFTAPTAEFEL